MDNPTGPSNTNKPRIAWGWWIVLLALLAWNIWSFWPKSKAAIIIPYRDFLTQVKNGNVQQVQIAGSEIGGTFITPIPAPEPTPANPQANQPSPNSGQAPTYAIFQTTFPEVEGDPNLIPLLSARNVKVNVSPPPNLLIGMLLSYVLPVVLLVLAMAWIGRQATRGQVGVFNIGRSKPRRYTGERPEVTFEDVAGVDEAKQELQEVVDFLRHPDKYHKLGARTPRGVLLVGPPGTGKTLLARAVSGEAGVPFFSISASEFVEMFVGVGASRVRDLFEQAKTTPPAIVFIDELDAVGRRRGAGLGNVNDEREQTLNQLLVVMDGFEEALDRILLVAARTLLLNDHERRIVAYHEGGHALVAWLTPAADPVHKVTIIPRGRALGVTEQLPGDDHYNYSREYLMARLAVTLAGRVAEEVTMDDITTGAENDLVEATRLARRMVTRWGMGSLGAMAIDVDEEQPFLGYELSQGCNFSEETAARIDQDVRHLLDERYEAVRSLLVNGACPKLDSLAQVLLQEETVDQDNLERTLGPRELHEERK